MICQIWSKDAHFTSIAKMRQNKIKGAPLRSVGFDPKSSRMPPHAPYHYATSTDLGNTKEPRNINFTCGITEIQNETEPEEQGLRAAE